MKPIVVLKRVVSWEHIDFEDIKVGDALRFTSGVEGHPAPGEDIVMIAVEEPIGSQTPTRPDDLMSVKCDPEDHLLNKARELLLKWIEVQDFDVPRSLVTQTMEWLKK